MGDQLPEYEHPPLEEMVIGVQFEPLKAFRSAHLGLYWSKIRNNYPETEDQVPISPMMEPETIEPRQPQAVVFDPSALPPTRCWFLDSTKTQLIQVQADRFIRNWRRVTGSESYPRFPFLLDAFANEWNRFLAFIGEEGLGNVVVNQCEINYVNHLEPGSGWSDYSELPKAMTLFREGKIGDVLPPTEVLACEARYRLPDIRGRLRVQSQPVFRSRDLKVISALNLLARGAPGGSDSESILKWFRRAHEWVVRAFDELTGHEMHNIWGKKT